MVARPTLLIALLLAFLPACAAFGMPSGRSVTNSRPAVATRFSPTMKSKEDKEFDEWVRQKKIASGVDPDEDFGAGRQQESKIYLVGGAHACRATILPLTNRQSSHAHTHLFAAVRFTVDCARALRPRHGPGADDRGSLGIQ